MPANLENSAVDTDWKKSVFILIPKKGNAKECSNYCTVALISHTSKVMLKILQAALQQYVNSELPDVQAGFRKGRGTRNQIAICCIIKKARVPHTQKKSTFALLTMAKPLTGIPISLRIFQSFLRRQISQKAGQVVWYSHLLKNYPVCCDPHSQRLWHSQ